MEQIHRIGTKLGVRFITLAVVDWIDVFTKPQYRDIVVNSLRFCQQKKGLQIHGWCIMTNRVHLIVSAKDRDLLSIISGFKRYTARRLIRAIKEDKNDARKEWMLSTFSFEALLFNGGEGYQFWQKEDHRIKLDTEESIEKKLSDIHQLPVRAGIVHEPENYIYCSAVNYMIGEFGGLLDVELL
jgi:putative transposase